MHTLTLHLISDSTCETVISVAQSTLEHFNSVKANEFVWSLVNSKKQIDNIVEVMQRHDTNFVMYTILNDELRFYLKEKCRALKVPCVPILAHIIREVSSYLNIKKDPRSISQGKLDADYFTRIDAINYTINHDDGQNLWDIDEADIILVGVSRSSKSPTSIYLSYRGYKVVNIPFVSSIPLPVDLTKFKDKLIVGLTINISRLIEIRKHRLVSMQDNTNQKYIDYEKVLEEINESRKLCMKNNWPIIDVSQRSIEEIAATIMQYYNKKKQFTL